MLIPTNGTRLLVALVLSLGLACSAVAEEPEARPGREELPPMLPEKVTLKAHQSIEKGLKFLASSQGRDGGWRSNGSFGSYPTRMTALGGLALLASSSTPSRGPYAPNIRKAVTFLLGSGRQDGLITRPEDGRS